MGSSTKRSPSIGAKKDRKPRETSGSMCAKKRAEDPLKGDNKIIVFAPSDVLLVSIGE